MNCRLVVLLSLLMTAPFGTLATDVRHCGGSISACKMTIHTQSHDLCEETCEETSCPVSGGDFLISHSQVLPVHTPPVRGRGIEDGDVKVVEGGDRLILRGLKFHGFHGVKPEERALGQKFLVDVDAWMDLRPAGFSDSLSDTISYTDIYRIVKEVVEGTPKNLLESVAQLIATTSLTKYPQITAVRVKIGKPHVAVHGFLDYLGVEILRRRSTDSQT